MNNPFELHARLALEKFPPEVLEIVWTHSLIVSEVGLIIRGQWEKKSGKRVDENKMRLGALVHDVGVYECFDDKYEAKDNYMMHQYLGYKILRKEGWPESVAKFALTHTPLLAEDIEKLKLPGLNIWYEPSTVEEEIVAYADIFHSKGSPGFKSFNQHRKDLWEINPICARNLDWLKCKFGEVDISRVIRKYEKWHEYINNWIINFRECKGEVVKYGNEKSITD